MPDTSTLRAYWRHWPIDSIGLPPLETQPHGTAPWVKQGTKNKAINARRIREKFYSTAQRNLNRISRQSS